MAPPKRKAGAAAPAAKKPKSNPNFAGVQDALERADLPESCRQMLLACIDKALGVPSDERQQEQHSMVGMIGECVQAVQAALQRAVDAEIAKMQELEGTKGELDAKVSAAEAALGVASADVAEKSTKLAEAAAAVQGARAGLQDRVSEQREGDRDRNEAAAKLGEVQAAIAEHFKPLEAGEEGTGEAHFAGLLPLLKDAAIDVSLMSALPSTCAKPPAERSSFDIMTIEHLGRSLSDRAAALQAAVDSGAPGAEERAAAVAAAKATLESSTASEAACNEQLAAAKSAEQEARKGLEAARAAAAAHGPELERTAKARQDREAALEAFVGYNVACFELLRDTKSAKGAEAELQLGEAAAAAAEAGA